MENDEKAIFTTMELDVYPKGIKVSASHHSSSAVYLTLVYAYMASANHFLWVHRMHWYGYQGCQIEIQIISGQFVGLTETDRNNVKFIHLWT